MARKERRYHYIYKITCLKNNRYYIGMHSTDNLEDGYMVGGKRIQNSVKKHGRDAHRKEILEFFENRSLLRQREIELVNEELLNDPMCMNLQPGGGGGFINKEHMKKFTTAGAISTNKKIKENPENWINSMKDNPEKISKRLKFLYESGQIIPSFQGKNHSSESILKMKNSAKGKHEGEKNSQYGTIWITNGTENKKIKNSEDIPENWRRGRI